MLGAYMAHPSIGSCTYHLHLVADRWNQVHIFHSFGGKCRWFVWRVLLVGDACVAVCMLANILPERR